MTITDDRIREHDAIEILRRYGRLLMKKHHRSEKSKLLKKVKEVAMKLVKE